MEAQESEVFKKLHMRMDINNEQQKLIALYYDQQAKER